MDVVVEHLKSSANSVNPNYFLPHHHHQTSQMPFMDGCSHHETSFMHASQGFLPSMASSYQSSFGTTSSSSPSYPSSSTSTSAYNSYCWMQRASSDYISPTGSSASSSTTMMMMPFYHHHPPSSVSPSVSNHSTSPERINKYHASEQYSNYATMNSMPHYYTSDHVYHHNHQSYESEVTPQTPGDQENNFETDNCLKRSSPESKKRVCRINGRKKAMPISETLSEPASSEKTTPPRKIERKRTVSINTAFASLRGRIPNVPNDTKLSKIKTLRLATAYISFLMQKLAEDPDDSAVSATEATTTPFGLEGFKVDLSRCKRSRNNTSLSAFLMTSSSSSCASANTTVLPSTSRRSRRVNKEAFTDLSHESITSYRLRARKNEAMTDSRSVETTQHAFTASEYNPYFTNHHDMIEGTGSSTTQTTRGSRTGWPERVWELELKNDSSGLHSQQHDMQLSHEQIHGETAMYPELYSRLIDN